MRGEFRRCLGCGCNVRLRITGENTMRKKLLSVVAAVLALSIFSPAQKEAPQQAVDRIQKQVRREIVMLPWFDVFDNITYKVDGYEVTLAGQVTRPTLKTDAEKAVKTIEGVEKVNNQI